MRTTEQNMADHSDSSRKMKFTFRLLLTRAYTVAAPRELFATRLAMMGDIPVHGFT
jgi:hypothetical protein